ncbi:MAG: tetratricopeptide repeat protein [Nitrososphaeraceae archaeon]|nr:tetratricopeptide repeat protein [Nitrososphaeraceae archaeon]
MKFKLIYLYALIIIAAIVLLFILTPKDNTNVEEQTTVFNKDNLPNDEIHNPLKSGSNTPSKENVSENFKLKMEELKIAAEQYPRDTIKLKEYADFLAAAHKVDDAIKIYNKILEIDPKKTNIYFAVTILYYNKGELKKAEELNDKVLSYDPQNTMALYNRGALSATRGEKDKAREIWQKLADDYPDTEVGMLAKESLLRL